MYSQEKIYHKKSTFFTFSFLKWNFVSKNVRKDVINQVFLSTRIQQLFNIDKRVYQLTRLIEKANTNHKRLPLHNKYKLLSTII